MSFFWCRISRVVPVPGSYAGRVPPPQQSARAAQRTILPASNPFPSPGHQKHGTVGTRHSFAPFALVCWLHCAGCRCAHAHAHCVVCAGCTVWAVGVQRPGIPCRGSVFRPNQVRPVLVYAVLLPYAVCVSVSYVLCHEFCVLFTALICWTILAYTSNCFRARCAFSLLRSLFPAVFVCLFIFILLIVFLSLVLFLLLVVLCTCLLLSHLMCCCVVGLCHVAVQGEFP